MGLLNSIISSTLKKRISSIESLLENPIEVQRNVFRNLVKTAATTEWGKKYDYKNIATVKEFSNKVPVSSYEDLFPYIERVMKGEQNILWPSPVKWFAKSSGTTNAKSKFIPVSKESLEECHYKGGKDLCAIYLNNNPSSQMFGGKSLAVGGALHKNFGYKDTYFGDISAVIMANLPVWAQAVRTPGLKVALMQEWEEKIQKIAQITSGKDVTNISGVPTWTMVLLEKILQLKGKDNMHEVWPSMEVFFHGAVAFHPYRDIFNKFFPEGIHYVETYNASEGFFGIQDRLKSDDMLLMLDYGIFYEFIPLDQLDSDDPDVLTIEEVELDKNYAMVISTNAGLWRYKIGDTVKFTSLKPFRIKISGRTKHFINAFGEEVIIENAETAIAKACSATSATIRNFTAGPVVLAEKRQGRHEWIVEFSTCPNSPDMFSQVLDETLKEVNSDYEAKRYKDMALQPPVIHHVPEGTFYNWMKKRGKLGGQNKVPRLANNREYIDDILTSLEKKEI
ncbi:GH3 auxin-responsive promoter family protein [Cytophagaceae bacterium ABcell3]|nr:GH3 auxin-responsive promoter family protein [Cytophagaceae bacterium ABcell3]